MSVVTRIAIEEGLESLPVVQSIVLNPGPHYEVSVCSRAAMAGTSADILLLDADAEPDATLAQVAALVRAEHSPKVLLLRTEAATLYSEEAIVHGASGVLDKSTPAALMLKVLTCVARGELWLDRQTTGRVFDRLARGIIKKKLLAQPCSGMLNVSPTAATSVRRTPVRRSTKEARTVYEL